MRSVVEKAAMTGLRRDDLIRALSIALVVAPILVLINQHDLIFAGEGPDPLKTGLTFCVPFCVSLYSSLKARRARSG